MKKVLVIAHHYPPIRASSNRTFTFTKYMHRYGWEPHVLTVDKPGRGDKEDYKIKIPENIKVSRTKCINNILTRAVFKYTKLTISNDYWIPYAVKEGLKIINEENINLIYCSIPYESAAVIGYKLFEKTGLPLVIDYRDPWFNKRYNNLQTKILEKAKAITTVNEGTKQEISKYTNKETDIIYNGIDLEELEKINVAKNEKFSIGCASSLFPNYKVKELIEAAKLSGKDIEVHIAGEPYQELKKYSKEIDLPVKFYGYLPHQESLEMLAKCHICFLGQDIPTARSGKIFEYIALGKPTLAMAPPNSDIETFVKGNKIGSCAYDVNKLADHIKAYFDNPKGLEIIVKKCKELAKQYDRVELTKQLTQIFDKVT